MWFHILVSRQKHIIGFDLMLHLLQGSMFILWSSSREFYKWDSWLTFFLQKRQSKMRRIANRMELNTRRNIKRPSFVAQSIFYYCLLDFSWVESEMLKERIRYLRFSDNSMSSLWRRDSLGETLMLHSLINHWHALTDGSFTKSLMQGS